MTEINFMNISDKLQKLSMLMHRLNRPEPVPHGPRGHAQERALNQIALRDGLTQRELMTRLGVQPSTISEMVDKLERTGLIERRSNEADRRQVNLYITENGRQHLERQNLEINRFDPFDALTENEQKDFECMLDRLIGFAEDECARRGLQLHPPRPFPGFEGLRPPHGHPPMHHHGFGPHHPPRPPFEEHRMPEPFLLSDEEHIEKL